MANMSSKLAERIGILEDRIQWLPIAAVKPYPNNPRKHPPEQVKALARSISEIGWARPIVVDENHVILGGHGCIAAARLLGLEKVPTIMVRGLSEEKKRPM